MVEFLAIAYDDLDNGLGETRIVSGINSSELLISFSSFVLLLVTFVLARDDRVFLVSSSHCHLFASISPWFLPKLL